MNYLKKICKHNILKILFFNKQFDGLQKPLSKPKCYGTYPKLIILSELFQIKRFQH